MRSIVRWVGLALLVQGCGYFPHTVDETGKVVGVYSPHRPGDSLVRIQTDQGREYNVAIYAEQGDTIRMVRHYDWGGRWFTEDTRVVIP